ncbi:hypothetical protein LTR87_009012 [Friedmanniomyces endolithicus]|nr:hypothetical protein LTR87_009012 [Friedmanniomyces endolithicus]
MSRKKKTKPTEAATQHPPHQPEPNTRLGVLITPRTGQEVGHPDSQDSFTTLTTLTIPLEFFVTQPWVPCPVTHALGLPLKATRWPSTNSRVPNNLALGLFLNPDPDAEAFGTIRFRRMDGAVVVAREGEGEGEEVGEREVEMVLSYLSGLSVGFTGFVRGEREKVEAEGGEEGKVEVQAGRARRARELAEKILTPRAFREYAKGRVVKEGLGKQYECVR